MSASAQYWLLIGEMPTGPFTVAQIHAKLATGDATWQTPACLIGAGEWLPLVRTPGIGPAITFSGGGPDDPTSEATPPPPPVFPTPPDELGLSADVDELPKGQKPSAPGSLREPAKPEGEAAKLYTSYANVPWYRRSGKMTAFVLIGFVLFPPLLWIACIICLTGGVYYDRRRKDGSLARWAVGNKVAAVIILLIQGAGIASRFQATPDPEPIPRASKPISRVEAERLVREQMEQQTLKKVDSIQLRDDANGGFVGEAKLGSVAWDVTVTVRDGKVSWEAAPNADKPDPAPLVTPHAEDKAVAFVEGLKGNVIRDEKLPGKPVIGVNLFGRKVTDAGLKELAGLKNLTTLGLGDTEVTDAGLTELAALTNLTQLSLYGTGVTDAGLKQLAPLKNLTSLDLSGTGVTDAGLKELTVLKNLTSLGLVGTKITDRGIKVLAEFKNLTSLLLYGSGLTNAGVAELQKVLPGCKIGAEDAENKAVAFVKNLGGKVTRNEELPSKPVVAVVLGRTTVTDMGLKELVSLKNLSTLDLGKTKVTDAGLKELAILKNLSELDLSGTEVTDAGLKELDALLQLTNLNLHGTMVTDAGVAELQKALPRCKIEADTAEDRAVAFVKNLGGKVTRNEKLPGKPIVEVDLFLGAWYTTPRITDAGLKELTVLKSLTALNLGGTKVTDAGLKELAALKNLTTLQLDQCRLVTGVGLKELAPLKNLTVLSLYLTGVTDAGLKELAAFTNLTTLSLPYGVTDAGLKELAPLKNLTTLNLYGTRVTDVGLKELAALKNLTTLRLRFTDVTDVGVKALAPLTKLTALDLGGTKVTDAGVKELAALKNLTTLDLSSEKITDAGLKELAALKNLTSLHLISTKVTDAGLKELQKTLPNCEISK